VRVPRHLLRHPDGRRLYVYGDLRGALPTGTDVETSAAALHQRHDALTDTWVAISPARNKRPHSSTVQTGPGPACPLCPGGPEVPFSYEAAVFENRFPSFRADPPPPPELSGVEPSLGRCEVVLYTERHEGSLATLAPDELARLIAIWADRSADLWADARHRFVLPFENRGEAVGATLSHPHGQIYAFDRIPPVIGARVRALETWRANHGSCLGCDLTAPGAGGGQPAGPPPRDPDAAAAEERRVDASDAFAVGVPFAPRWPYEVHVRARRHGARRLTDLDATERRELARVLRRAVLRYDDLFDMALPYMMVIHEAPDGADDWHLSVEFYPPHRSATLTKIRASVETATGLFINDTVPEASGATLRAIDVPETGEVEPVEIDRQDPAGRAEQP
jgi:UDPglucose--hexose-1-phosphate uridylyltransferase